MDALTRWLERDSLPGSVRTAVAEVVVHQFPGSPADGGRTIWRSTIPVRSDWRCGAKLAVNDRTGAGVSSPTACELFIEARCEVDQSDHDARPWKVTASATLGPPVTDRPLTMPETTETGTRDGVVLCRALGRTAAGEELVLTIRLREQKVRSRWWRELPGQELWWRRQLAKAGR
jgi:hypothetical protein